MNCPRTLAARTFAAAVLVCLACGDAMADPVDVNPLFLWPQTSLTGHLESYAQYGNRIGDIRAHNASLKRVVVDSPSPGIAPHGGLLAFAPSLDVAGSGWWIVEKGAYVPGVNGARIPGPYFLPGEPLPSPAIIPSEIFYIGFIWSYDFGFEPRNVVSGWAQLQAPPPAPGSPPGTLNPDLILLASAHTLDARGIIVGEYRVIPEPSTFATMTMGVGLAVWRSRRVRA